MTQDVGPPNVREAIKAFKNAQELRVKHWKEYDEALALYQQSTEQRGSRGTSASSTNHPASGHYHTEALPMTDEVFSKVVSLVTSGLLDSSHSVRAIETELRSRFKQDHLADLVGQVQDRENAVLRKIVQRDQDRRKASVEGRDVDEAEFHSMDAAVAGYRREIQELIAEINAEVAELEE